MAESKPRDEQKTGDSSPDDGNADDGNPEYENFQRFLKGALSVPKEELDRRREKYERERKRAV